MLEASLYASVTPLLPHYVEELGLSDRAAGILVACYPLGIVFGSCVGAVLAPRFGVRATCQLALLVLAATCLLFGVSEDLIVLDVSRFVGGLGAGCLWSAALTWLMSTTEESRRGSTIGTAFGAGVFGSLIGPAIGSLALMFGISVVFGAVAAIAVALSFVVLHHPSPRALVTERLPADRPSLFRDRALRLGIWLTVLPALGYGAMNVIAPLRMDGLGAPDWQVALLFLLTGTTVAVVAPFMGRAIDRHGAGRPARVLLVVCIPCLAFAGVPQSTLLLAALLILGIGALSTVTTAGATLLSYRAERVGLGLAVVSAGINIFFALGEMLGSLGSAFIIEAAPDAVPLWLLASAALVTTIVLSMPRTSRSDLRPVAATSRSATGDPLGPT